MKKLVKVKNQTYWFESLTQGFKLTPCNCTNECEDYNASGFVYVSEIENFEKIKKISTFCSDDNDRLFMQVVQWDDNHIIATDGKRMVWTSDMNEALQAIQFQIPSKIIKDINKNEKNIKVYKKQDEFMLETEAGVIYRYERLGIFPAWKRVIPDYADTEIHDFAIDFSAIKFEKFSKKTLSKIIATPEKTIQVIDDYEFPIPLQFPLRENEKFKMNCKFFMDLQKIYGKKFRGKIGIKKTEDDKIEQAIYFEADGFKSLVMPLIN